MQPSSSTTKTAVTDSAEHAEGEVESVGQEAVPKSLIFFILFFGHISWNAGS